MFKILNREGLFPDRPQVDTLKAGDSLIMAGGSQYIVLDRTRLPETHLRLLCRTHDTSANSTSETEFSLLRHAFQRIIDRNGCKLQSKWTLEVRNPLLAVSDREAISRKLALQERYPDTVSRAKTSVLGLGVCYRTALEKAFEYLSWHAPVEAGGSFIRRRDSNIVIDFIPLAGATWRAAPRSAVQLSSYEDLPLQPKLYAHTYVHEEYTLATHEFIHVHSHPHGNEEYGPSVMGNGEYIRTLSPEIGVSNYSLNPGERIESRSEACIIYPVSRRISIYNNFVESNTARVITSHVPPLKSY